MRKPIFIRARTPDEQHALDAGLRATNSFTMRRCQILLASSRGQHARLIAANLGCDDQTVRNAIHAFNTRGLAALQPGSTVAHHLPHAMFDASGRERLREMLHRSPRTFGHPTSVWSLPLVAKVAYAEGITPREVSREAIRLALKHLGVSWKRAKHWITSPDPAYVRKKTARPFDTAGRAASGLGAGLCGRSLVEQVGSAPHAHLATRPAGAALDRENADQRRC